MSPVSNPKTAATPPKAAATNAEVVHVPKLAADTKIPSQKKLSHYHPEEPESDEPDPLQVSDFALIVLQKELIIWTLVLDVSWDRIFKFSPFFKSKNAHATGKSIHTLACACTCAQNTRTRCTNTHWTRAHTFPLLLSHYRPDRPQKLRAWPSSSTCCIYFFKLLTFDYHFMCAYRHTTNHAPTHAHSHSHSHKRARTQSLTHARPPQILFIHFWNGDVIYGL